LENSQANLLKDIVRWLAPREGAPYGIDFYQVDLAAAFRPRQRGTREWILNDEKYVSWKAPQPQSQSNFLWINAIPGQAKPLWQHML
jgi:hypothetical protein